MTTIPRFDLQAWFFDSPVGKREIDLGESGVAARDLRELPSLGAFDLDYGIDRGTAALRAAIAQLYGVESAEVIVTHGSEEALFLAYAVLLEPRRPFAEAQDEAAKGCHVVAFSPGWQQAWEVPAFLGADVTKIRRRPEEGYAIPWHEVSQAVRPETRLVISNSPGSPMGTAYTSSDWQQLAHLAHERRLTLINDEVYLEDPADSIIQHVSGSLAVSSLSKTYGFPGLRIGWCVGPRQIIDQMVNLKRYMSVCNSPLCEHLAVDVLRMRSQLMKDYVDMRRAGLAIVRDWCASESVTMVDATQTPFAYVDVRAVPLPSIQIANRLLREKGVLTVPGEVFGDEQTLRISFGRPAPQLCEGLSRISNLFHEIRN